MYRIIQWATGNVGRAAVEGTPVFEAYTREIDNRHYRITYRQLDAILRRYGFKLIVHGANSTDVILEHQSKGFLGIGRRTIERRVSQIGFRNWGEDVSMRDLRKVREDTGLTAEKGYDSQVFFQRSDPMISLIAQYQNPSRRLAKK